MANLFTELLRNEPHSMQEIRESLDNDFINETDFVAILKAHHDYLHESIFVLTDPNANDEDKRAQTIRFFQLVDMHAQAEQETLYVQLQQNEDKQARIEGFGGEDEHDLVFQLEDELLDMGYLTTWNEEISAKVKIAANLILNHINEEEDVMFPVALKDLTSQELETLRVSYLRKCKTYLDEARSKPWVDRNLNRNPGYEDFRL